MFVLIWATLLVTVRSDNPNPAEHHATTVPNSVSCINDTTAEQNVTLNVTYVKKNEITGNSALKEGDTLNLTCSVESFSPSSIMWTKLGPNKTLLNETKLDFQNDNEKAVLIIPDVTAEHSGQYICTAEHLNSSLTQRINITVMYVKKPEITGNSILKEGDALNLTCSTESFSPSRIMWTKLGSNKTLLNETKLDLQNDNEKAVLIIPNVTAEHAGQYICTAEHMNSSLTQRINVTVMFSPRILSNSTWEELENRTCVCISEEFSLPTITWSLLKNHTTNVSNHVVNCVSVEDYNFTTVECINESDTDQHGPSAVLPWAVAVVSLIVNVICIICVMFLWNTRKKVKPNQEDRTYMSLQKTDPSPEYDLIGQPQN